MADLAIATCLTPPELDTDAPLLAAALAVQGLHAEVLAWDDPAARFSEAPITVIRSTWNYVHHYDAFIAWAQGLDARLVNPACVVRWNAHKRYLKELNDEGIAAVPTVLIPQGTGVPLEKILRQKQWFRAVAKPAVGAGSFATKIVTHSDGEWFATQLHARDMLIQPYVQAVETSGERGLIFIDGEFTHAVKKRPRYAGDKAEASATQPDADEVKLAERALSYVTRRLPCGELLYARVDLVRDDNGAPSIMELELIEPFLFFANSAPALERFAAGVKKRISYVRR